MLVAHDLSLILRGRTVLSGVTARFRPGEVSAVVGANGAGKSSLLACLAGLAEPTAGAIQIDEATLSSLSAKERARLLSYLPQRPEIAWDVDVEHLVGLGRLPWDGGDGPQDRLAVSDALGRANLSDFSKRKAQRLSGGEQARVHLARMLAGEARWLLLDEPFAALDPAHVLAAARLLREEAARGAGVIVVVHDLTLAAHLADHVLILKEGRVLDAGTPAVTFTPDRLSEAFATPMKVTEGEDGLHISPDWRTV